MAVPRKLENDDFEKETKILVYQLCEQTKKKDVTFKQEVFDVLPTLTQDVRQFRKLFDCFVTFLNRESYVFPVIKKLLLAQRAGSEEEVMTILITARERIATNLDKIPPFERNAVNDLLDNAHKFKGFAKAMMYTYFRLPFVIASIHALYASIITLATDNIEIILENIAIPSCISKKLNFLFSITGLPQPAMEVIEENECNITGDIANYVNNAYALYTLLLANEYEKAKKIYVILQNVKKYNDSVFSKFLIQIVIGAFRDRALTEEHKTKLRELLEYAIKTNNMSRPYKEQLLKVGCNLNQDAIVEAVLNIEKFSPKEIEAVYRECYDIYNKKFSEKAFEMLRTKTGVQPSVEKLRKMNAPKEVTEQIKKREKEFRKAEKGNLRKEGEVEVSLSLEEGQEAPSSPRWEAPKGRRKEQQRNPVIDEEKRPQICTNQETVKDGDRVYGDEDNIVLVHIPHSKAIFCFTFIELEEFSSLKYAKKHENFYYYTFPYFNMNVVIDNFYNDIVSENIRDVTLKPTNKRIRNEDVFRFVRWEEGMP